MEQHWSVVTPMYTNYYDMWGDEPPEYTCDYVEVEAETRRKALVAGVKKLRAENSEWMEDCRSDNASPFTGLKAERLRCEHGYCFCTLHDCIQPNAEWILLDSCPVCDEERKLNCEHEVYSGDTKCWKCDAEISNN